jgi:hypothetical protein
MEIELKLKSDKLTYYHGSKTRGIQKLIPDYSLHGQKYVYLTTSFEVALIYTVNAIESFYDENNFDKPDKFQPWYSYGFNKDKVPVIEEYYPDATRKTYENKTGYIYVCKEPKKFSNPTNIHNAIVTKEEVHINSVISIDNIYAKMLELEKKELLLIKRYQEMSKEYLKNIYKMIKQDIKKYDLINKPAHNYTVFLKSKFPFLF